MYEEFYGLKENPFALTPDPKFLFLSEKHKEAFSHLIYGINQRKGFIEITGEIGTGKTTLCRALLNKVGKKTRTALILNPILSRVELLKAILEDLGLEREGESEKELLERLNKFLIEELSKGGNVAVIIDESQDLAPSLLEEIRLLSNLETEKEKLLQIVLVGQLELHHKLNSPSLKQLNQRIAVRYHLTALNKSETVEYIYYRLKVAGSQGNIKFTPGALRRIYNYSQGTPRMINILADKALLAGYISETDRITSKIVKRAIKEIRGEELEKRPFLLKELSRSLVFTLIILGIGLSWLWRSEILQVSPERNWPAHQQARQVSPIETEIQTKAPLSTSKIETLTDLAKFWGGLLLCPGMADPPKVKKLQECLKKLGYYQGSSTDNFSEGTKKAVMNFQRDNQIKVDGLVGPETKAVLYYRLLSKNEYYK